MKTKKYLERLLKNEAVLSGNVAQSAYRRVDFDVDAAVEFANAAALNMLIKLSKLAKLFEAHYAETVSQKKTGLIQLFRRGWLDRERRFWEIFGTEVAKIRTRRMLEAMTRDGKLHVRRNNLDFNAEAAKAYYLSLDEEKSSCCSATSAEKLIIRSGFFRKIWKKRKSAPAISRTTKTAPFSGVRFGIF